MNVAERDETACVAINSILGEELLQISPVPLTVQQLKEEIAKTGRTPVAMQQLLREGDDSHEPLCDDEELAAVDQAITLIVDDRPQWFWDTEGTKQQVQIEDNVITCPNMRSDYVNVLTQEPISAGLHYFQFHLHHYADEQWCGLTPHKCDAGNEFEKAVPSKTGFMYYTGRAQGALEAQGSQLKKLELVPRVGSVIGMLVDCDAGAVAFDLGGRIQGACEIPKNTRLWVLTHVDTPRDHVELKKLDLEDAPPSNLDALKGALLNPSHGTCMTRDY